MNTKYKLLVLDIDGTIADENGHISEGVKAAVQQVRDAGVIVTLASGRACETMLEYAQLLGISELLVGYQGAQIKDARTGEVLYEITFPRSLLSGVVELSRERDWDLSVYADDKLYLEEIRHPQDFYDLWFGLPLVKTDDIIAALPSDPIKFIITASPDEADKVHTELKTRFDHNLNIVRSHKFFVEGNPPNVTKGRAVARLAELLGVPREEVIAIGDNENDANMIAWAGLGVAMANGSDAAKAQADYIAPAVEEDGVVEVIRRFVLDERGEWDADFQVNDDKL